MSSTYSYDQGTNGIGRRTGIASGTVSNSWTYDARGRVHTATVTAGTAYTTTWEYNSADLPTSMTYPDEERVTYGYNDRKLLETLGSYVTSSEYDSAGRLTSRALGNGLSQSFTYYPWDEEGGRLQLIQASSGGAIQKLEYDYDPVGNVNWIKDWNAGTTPQEPQQQSFTYDALDRLTHATVTGGSDGLYDEGYAYDETTGNLATKGGAALTYGDSSHVHAATGYNGNTYGYDANGNMTTRVIGSDTFQLSYDAENRLVSVSGPSLSASFVYDGDGNRVQSTIGTVTTTFVGSYYEVTGETVTKYYYAGASRVAMSVDGTVYYLLSDQLGSTSITTDASGAKVSELRYDAWGSVRYKTTDQNGNDNTPTAYRYTGQYSHADEFGLLYYNARWYDPTIARFVQADTVVPGGVQGYDRYAYTANNPVRYRDPNGHLVCEGDDPCTPSDPCTVISSGAGNGSGNGGADSQPYVITLSNNVVIIILPPGGMPQMPRPDILRRLGVAAGILGFISDLGELAALLDILPGDEDVIALEDVGVTYLAGALGGQNYVFEKPEPSLPYMITVNQDLLVTAGDAGGAGLVKLGGAAAGGPIGYAAGEVADAATTLGSAVYDYSRNFGSLPVYVSVGVAVTSTDLVHSGNTVILIAP